MDIASQLKSLGYNKLAFELQKIMVQNDILLVYQGEVNQELTKAFTSMTEKNMESSEDSSSVRKKVYHVMVECLQNINKHSDEYKGNSFNSGEGIFIVAQSEGSYMVTSGNLAKVESVIEIKKRIEHVNSLSKEEVKELYKKTLKENRLSEKSGAGLGFIDIVKKTGNKIDYYFEQLNDSTSYFIQTIKITKK